MFQFFKSSPPVRHRTQLGLEVLEDRQLLSGLPLGAGWNLSANVASTAVVAQPVAQGPAAVVAQPSSLVTAASVAGQASPGSSSSLTDLGTSPQGGGAYYADQNNQVFQWDGSQWHYQSQGTVAPDGSFWFLAGSGGSSSAPLYRSANGQMQQYGSWTGLLGVTNDGSVWVTEGSHVIRGNSSNGWTDQSATSAGALAQSDGLGAAVTADALHYLGQTDPPGSQGDCTDLVMAALEQAGAATTENFGVTGSDANYVWGTLVADHSVTDSGGQTVGSDALSPLPARAGDIIQFRDVTLVDHTTGPDGTTWTQTMNMEHHTAIIEAVLGGGSYRILEENWDGGKPDGRVVRESTINLSDMTQGQYWIYQPVAV